MTILTKTRTVLVGIGNGVYQSDPDKDFRCGHIVIVDPEVLEEMGKPAAITVTIESGDKLNG